MGGAEGFDETQGIARAARILGLHAVIVMPRDAPAIKVAGVRAERELPVVWAVALGSLRNKLILDSKMNVSFGPTEREQLVGQTG